MNHCRKTELHFRAVLQRALHSGLSRFQRQDFDSTMICLAAVHVGICGCFVVGGEQWEWEGGDRKQSTQKVSHDFTHCWESGLVTLDLTLSQLGGQLNEMEKATSAFLVLFLQIEQRWMWGTLTLIRTVQHVYLGQVAWFSNLHLNVRIHSVCLKCLQMHYRVRRFYTWQILVETS